MRCDSSNWRSEVNRVVTTTTTTKYTKKQSRGRSLDSRNDKVVIADNSDNDIKEYICNSCNRIRHTRQSKGELECLHCGAIIELSNVRRKSKLETPHQNTETLVSTTQTPGFGDVKIKHEPELQGGFLVLSQKGLKIKDYREDIPS